MHRLISFLLAVIMTVAVFVSCSSKDETSNPTDSTEASHESSVAPAAKGVVTDKMETEAGAEGTVPQVYDAVIDYLEKEIDDIVEIKSTRIMDVYDFSGETFVKKESDIVNYTCDTDFEDVGYFDVYYNMKTEEVTSTLYEEVIENECNKVIRTSLQLPDAVDSYVTVAHFDGEIVVGYPTGIRTYDDIVKDNTDGKYIISCSVSGLKDDLSVDSFTDEALETIVSAQKLSNIDIDIYETVIDGTPYAVKDKIRLFIDDGEDLAKQDIHIIRTHFDQKTFGDVETYSNEKWVVVEAVEEIDAEDVPEREVKLKGRTPAKALKVTLRKVADCNNYYDEINEHENVLGGITHTEESNVYGVDIVANGDYIGLYVDTYGEAEENSDLNGQKGMRIETDRSINEFDSDGTTSFYIVFYEV